MRTFWFIPLLASSLFFSCDDLTGPDTEPSHWFLLREKQEGKTFQSIHFSSPSQGWVVGSAGTIEHSSDGGATWHAQQSGVSTNLWDVWFVDDRIGWICGGGNTLLKTTDGGGSWLSISPPVTYSSLYISVRFVDNNIGWMNSSSGEILRSTDGGISWEVKKQFALTARLAVLDANTAIAYIGKLYRTTDGGSTWDSVAVAIPQYYRDSDMFFFDAYHGWIATQNGTGGMMINDYPVVFTSNAALSWSLSDLVSDYGLNCVHFVTKDIGWVAGIRNIHKTTDGGRHWICEFSPAEGVLGATSICFLNEDCGWVINWRGEVYKCSGVL